MLRKAFPAAKLTGAMVAMSGVIVGGLALLVWLRENISDAASNALSTYGYIVVG